MATQRLSGVLGMGVAFSLLLSLALFADGTITGHARFEKIKGKPHMGHVELYESNLFLDFEQRSSGGNQWRINCFDEVFIEDLDEEILPVFFRGDCDSTSERQMTDAIYLLNYLFKEPREIRCFDACDMNDDSNADLSDAVFLLNYLFLGGVDIPAPGSECGPDPTPDDGLDCLDSPCS